MNNWILEQIDEIKKDMTLVFKVIYYKFFCTENKYKHVSYFWQLLLHILVVSISRK